MLSVESETLTNQALNPVAHHRIPNFFGYSNPDALGLTSTLSSINDEMVRHDAE